MIAYFSIKNTLSIKDTQCIDFRAVGDDSFEENHIVKKGNENILRMSCMFGPNASGKSNLIKAFRFYIDFIVSSFFNDCGTAIKHTPFLFDKFSYRDSPGEFEIGFYTKDFTNPNNICRYKYYVKLNYQQVLEEELYFAPKGQMKLVFSREKENIKWGTDIKGQKDVLRRVTKERSSVISTGAQFNHPVFMLLYDYFSKLVQPRFNLDKLPDLIENDNQLKSNIVKLLQSIDIGPIVDIGISKKRIDKVVVLIYQSDKSSYYGLLNDESSGTRRVLELVIPFLLHPEHSFFIFDDIEISLHPLLLRFILQTFLEMGGDSQLFFTTHLVSLMDFHILRRDEIWFCDTCVEDHSSKYYSLIEFKGIKQATDIKRSYLRGCYGAVPIIDSDELQKFVCMRGNDE